MNLFDMQSWETASYVVTVIGLPVAIAIFLADQRKERRNEEEESWQRLSDAYNDFLQVVIEHPDLRLGTGRGNVSLTPEQEERMMVIFTMLIGRLRARLRRGVGAGHDPGAGAPVELVGGLDAGMVPAPGFLRAPARPAARGGSRFRRLHPVHRGRGGFRRRVRGHPRARIAPWPGRTNAGTSSAASSTTTATWAWPGGWRGASRASTAKRVRLILDDLTVLARLRPETDPARDAQRIDGVDVRRWDAGWNDAVPPGEVADVVVETFGCDTPEPYVRAMAARAPHPRWINLEYLSAEEWVEGSHALPSPHPALRAAHAAFLLPGLHRAHGRAPARARPPRAARRLPGRPRGAGRVLAGPHGCPAPRCGPEGEPLRLRRCALRGAARGHDAPRRAGVARRAGGRGGDAPCPPGSTARPGASAARSQAFAVPFLDQDRYDELLWACDLNFVRGEDSFVRAQWAARPFVWHIYPTRTTAPTG